MESDDAALTLGYVNRRPVGRRAPERAGSHTEHGPDGGHRSARRIARVALRAYEQRAQRREQLRAWLRLHGVQAAPPA